MLKTEQRKGKLGQMAQNRDCDVDKQRHNGLINFLKLTLIVAPVNKHILSSFMKSAPPKTKTNHTMSRNYYVTLLNTIPAIYIHVLLRQKCPSKSGGQRHVTISLSFSVQVDPLPHGLSEHLTSP